MQAKTKTLIETYYSAFNSQNIDAMLALLHDDIAHDVSQGERRLGKDKFRAFLQHMNRCYHEQLSDIVVMINEDGSRAAAEFKLAGKYLVTDDGLPDAAGQEYHLTVGTFFEIKDNKITRVSTHYNLLDWTRQVVG